MRARSSDEHRYAVRSEPSHFRSCWALPLPFVLSLSKHPWRSPASFDRLRTNGGGLGSAGLVIGHSTIWVWVTTATNVPSSRVIFVCHTDWRRPTLNGMASP